MLLLPLLLIAALIDAKHHHRHHKHRKHHKKNHKHSISQKTTNQNVTDQITLNQNILNQGSGLGSYYYDANGNTCGEKAFQENMGITTCESWSNTASNMPLIDRKNNFIVALDSIEMAKNRNTLCGKRVIVTYQGKEIDAKFVVWDACGACSYGKRLDFSVSALKMIAGDSTACADGVVPGISWTVVDEQVIPFVP